MATYRIGPDDFFAGGDLQADAYTLNSMVQATERVVSEVPSKDPRLSDDLFQAWAVFSTMWNSYFASDWDKQGDVGNFLAALNDANRDQLIQYEMRFADIYDKLKAVGIESAYVNVQVSTGAPDTVKRLLENGYSAFKKLGLAGLGLGTLVVIGLVLWFFVIPLMRAKAVAT